MPDAGARIAELEAKVATLEQKMQDMADVVGSTLTHLGFGMSSGSPLVWVEDDCGDGEEPDIVRYWALPEEVLADA